jgi:hypothetical protein
MWAIVKRKVPENKVYRRDEVPHAPAPKGKDKEKLWKPGTLLLYHGTLYEWRE